MQQNPTEKPPYTEGDLFSSLFESFTSFKVGKVKASHNTHTVSIQLVHNTPNQKPYKWHDEAILGKENYRYVINNICLIGAGAFNSSANLLDNLSQNLS